MKSRRYYNNPCTGIRADEADEVFYRERTGAKIPGDSVLNVAMSANGKVFEGAVG